MTTKTKKFGGFSDDTQYTEDAPDVRWPMLTYNNDTGQWRLKTEGEDDFLDQSMLRMNILMVRQCKVFTDANGVEHVFGIYTKRAEIPTNLTWSANKVHAVVYLPDLDIFAMWAMASFTARTAFMNPAEGRYRVENFPTGTWPLLRQMVQDIYDTDNVNIPHYSFTLEMAPAKKRIKVGKDKVKMVIPAQPVVTPEYDNAEALFIGAEKSRQLKDWMTAEKLNEWRDEWHGKKPALAEGTTETWAASKQQDDDDGWDD